MKSFKIIMLFFALFDKISASIPGNTAANCVYKEDTDYGDSGTFASASSKEDCCNICSNDTRCIVAVFYQKICNIKYSNHAQRNNSGRIACNPVKSPTPAPPPTPSPTPTPDANLRFGASHWAGCYSMTSEPFLLDGAKTVYGMGARIIKLFFGALKPERGYSLNSNWTGCCSTLKQLAQYSYFRTVFDMNFSTFVLVAYSGVNLDSNYWVKGITESELAQERQEFYDLSVYLLTTYPDKTFVFQNWEGDWSLRHGNYDPKHFPSATANNNMVKWLTARQQGVTEGRQHVRISNQKGNVYLAAEVNLVADPMNLGTSAPDMILEVVPRVSLDIISYSSYDTQKTSNFTKALDFIAQHHNRTKDSPDKAVVIGEYGLPQNLVSPQTLKTTVKNVINSCIQSKHCWYAMFWEVYGNEQKNGPTCNGIKHPITDPSKLHGFWLVKPDGSKQWPYTYLQSLYK